MTLRLDLVAGQLAAVVERHRAALEEAAATADAALEALRAWAADPEAGNDAIRTAMEGSVQPYALASPLERPDGCYRAPPAEACTVVAADGSSIGPDRFAAVPCWVVNVGAVALPYGVGGEPLLESRPRVGPTFAGEASEGGDAPDEAAAAVRGGVTLLRDVMELESASELACARVEYGPVVALLDGTLLPWDLDSPQIPSEVRNRLRDRVAAALERMRAAGERLSLGAYISASRAADVVNSLRVFAPGARSWLWGDAPLFVRLLRTGERSALFRARSERARRVEEQFPAHEVCFFYVRIDDDLARVELPAWAATSERVGRLHAALLAQSVDCGGYPRALQEAHELAVISTHDRELFARLLEAESARHGLHSPLAGKQRSKRRRPI